MDQLCLLCYSNWLDSWVNIALVRMWFLIEVHKWKELLLATGLCKFTLPEQSHFCLNSNDSYYSFSSDWWQVPGWPCYLAFLIQPSFYAMNMWSCIITFLHYLLVIRPVNIFIRSQFFIINFKACLSHSLSKPQIPVFFWWEIVVIKTLFKTVQHP